LSSYLAPSSVSYRKCQHMPSDSLCGFHAFHN
jgi:hypothetical protein